jgi:hypothetical protein
MLYNKALIMFTDEAIIQRAKDIYQMRKKGKMFKEIGGKFNILEQRANQVFRKKPTWLREGKCGKA